MNLYDVKLTISGDNILKDIQWNNGHLESLFSDVWGKYVGADAAGLLEDMDYRQPFGTYDWEGFELVHAAVETGDGLVLLIKHNDHRNLLYEKAMNYLNHGLQIYDSEASAVFFNTKSLVMSEFDDVAQVEGRHLLDIYELDENISTTLTSLRTGRPVINRVDHFRTSDGTLIASSNTAYPLLHNDTIIGAAVLEYDKALVENEINTMKSIDEAMDSFKGPETRAARHGYTFTNILGNGEKVRAAVTIARRVAAQSSSVLLVGETGTGKELFAQSIHNESPRADKPFVAINCAAIPDTLIEGLLFGTAKGSFTGSEDKPGYFEEANGGTLFIDELNSMSLTMQSKLLRVVQEKTFRRVGGDKDIKIDIRFISSCNEDPFEVIKSNRLRQDLFYRLSTVMIELPPLRDHMEDISNLVKARVRNNNGHFANKISEVEPEVMNYLNQYNWPGNVRELFHVVDYAQNITDGETIKAEHLPRYLQEKVNKSDGKSLREASGTTVEYGESGGPAEINWSTDTLQSLMDDYECLVLTAALDHYGSNITQTAKALDIKRQSLQYRLKKYGIIV